MLPWLRNIIVIILVLTLIYAVLSAKARRQYKDKLAGAYEASDKSEDKALFITKGLSRYQRSYRPKLILTVYFIPIAVMSLLIYLANHT
jgi:hypothetical protein